MFKETRLFLWDTIRDRAIYKDAELWTALAAGVGFGWWCKYDPTVANIAKEHLSDIMTAASILAGCVMTTMAFYVQTAVEWKVHDKGTRIGTKIIRWNILTFLVVLALLIYSFALVLVDGRVNLGIGSRHAWYGVLAFLMVYGTFQIWNHAMTALWVFTNIEKLKNESGTTPPAISDGGQAQRAEDQKRV